MISALNEPQAISDKSCSFVRVSFVPFVHVTSYLPSERFSKDLISITDLVELSFSLFVRGLQESTFSAAMRRAVVEPSLMKPFVPEICKFMESSLYHGEQFEPSINIEPSTALILLNPEPESVNAKNLTEVFRCALVIFGDYLETLANWPEDFFGSCHLLKSLAIFLTYF